MTKRLLDVRFENENGKLVRINSYDDGSTQRETVTDRQVQKMLRAIEATPDIQVLNGGKTPQKYPVGTVIKGGKEAGKFEVLFGLLLGAIAVVAVSCLSGCIPEEDERCFGPKWDQYKTCRRFHNMDPDMSF
jgi:hypothetical protein